MQITATKSDIIWSYAAQFITTIFGVLLLPIVIEFWSVKEVSVYYIYLMIASIANLFELGYTGQIAKNISFIMSGANTVQKVGFSNGQGYLNTNLLYSAIKAADDIYKRNSIYLAIFLGLFGSWYVSNIYDKNMSVESWLTWILFFISVVLNFRFSYFNALLSGSGKIRQLKSYTFYSKVVLIVLLISGSVLDLGLLSYSFANLVSIALLRYWLSRVYFGDVNTKGYKEYKDWNAEVIRVKENMAHNAVKMAQVIISAFITSKLGFFIIALVESDIAVAKYGIMLQLITMIQVLANLPIGVFGPELSSYLVNGKKGQFLQRSSTLFRYTMFVFMIIYFSISLTEEELFSFIGKEMYVLNKDLWLLLGLIAFLELSHSTFCTLLSYGNEIPFNRAAMATSLIFLVLLGFLYFKGFLNFKSMLLVQFLVHAFYNNWKWPLVFLRRYQIRLSSFLMGKI